jgi:hypothetical protein
MLAVAVLVLAVVSWQCSFGQTSDQFPLPRIPSPNQTPTPGQPSPEDEQRARIEKEMAKKASQERQAQLKRDAENLLKLATELKQDVDKSTENTLSLEVVKKAEEIEKLAKSVKEKMKGN